MNQEIKNKRLYLKKPYEILQQAQAAKILFNFLYEMNKKLKVDMNENQIEFEAKGYYRKYNIESSMRNYNGFIADISVSRNEVLAHGIPSEYKLQNNDIITVDLVANSFGWHADLSWTYIIGKSDIETKLLREAAWKVSRVGVQVARPGNTLNDIAQEISEEAERLGIYVYNNFAGHGIGRDVHEYPTVYYKQQDIDIPLKPGMVICIEPIVSLKAQSYTTATNGAIIGANKYKSACFEHMVAIFNSESRLLSSDLLPLEALPLRPFF